MGGQLQVLELPLAVNSHILFIVAGGAPNRPVAIGEGARLEKIPGALAGVTVNLNDGVGNHVYSEGQPLRGVLEEGPD